MNEIAIIGDVHGETNKYMKLLDRHKYTVQVGDLGFNYNCLRHRDPECHKFFQGNHDNYNAVRPPHCLGDYGVRELNGIKFFFIRGAFSIDWRYRVEHEMKTGQKAWWKEEQLTHSQMQKCFEAYEEAKPDFVISHSCPVSVGRRIGNKSILREFGFDPDTFTTYTQELLQACFDIHQPKLWTFGHFHKPHRLTEKGTVFRCVPTLCAVRVNSDLKDA